MKDKDLYQIMELLNKQSQRQRTDAEKILRKSVQGLDAECSRVVRRHDRRVNARRNVVSAAAVVAIIFSLVYMTYGSVDCSYAVDGRLFYSKSTIESINNLFIG